MVSYTVLSSNNVLYGFKMIFRHISQIRYNTACVRHVYLLLYLGYIWHLFFISS